MKLTQQGRDLILSEMPNFDPFVSAECGQCFRFEKISEDEYFLVACNRGLNVKRLSEGWLFADMNEDEFNKSFVSYFDLERDYGKIIEGFSFDENISRGARAGNGIRIFRQDPWETLISFIISQNNNIPRIKKIISSLCALLGDEISDGVYSFPSAERILEAGLEGIAPIKSGFRGKYIIDAAEKVASREIDLDEIGKIGYKNALAALKTIKGVGDKVANCVLLFGFGYYNAFPVDVWVKRVIEKYYGGSFDSSALGEYAGIAQQYLFHYERNMTNKQDV